MMPYYHRLPSNNAHKLTTGINILLRESLATATLLEMVVDNATGIVVVVVRGSYQVVNRTKYC